METPEAVVAAFQDAWNAHDMTALEGLFRDRADFVNVHGLWWRDRETIAQRHRAAHAGPYARSVLEGQLRSLESLAPDLALAQVDWRLQVPVPESNAPGAAAGKKVGKKIGKKIGGGDQPQGQAQAQSQAQSQAAAPAAQQNAGTKTKLSRSIMTLLLQRGDEGWRIRAAQNTEKSWR